MITTTMTLLTMWLLTAVLQTEIPEVPYTSVDERIRNGHDTVYVVHFWATWCRPCINELSVFEKTQRTAFSRPVQVLLVSLDRSQDRQTVVEPLLKRKGYRLPCVLLDTHADESWRARVDSSWTGTIPATLLVDASTQQRAFFERTVSYQELRHHLQDFISSH